ncbi:MAG TPA: bifunctional [glutamine synthetase] adenylyltransferase/[glutamine synthetase]-adenylyl-L-tyrosine phosphorylase [Hyphomicrobiaceae bacterium]|nr:bifunctional [glutamine synthetase] adenylyltransferase/[glutamine synthetase]-adenylyl-L-tyrosine phosphorylase [Hyphomicrobiaceae bacterium]
MITNSSNDMEGGPLVRRLSVSPLGRDAEWDSEAAREIGAALPGDPDVGLLEQPLVVRLVGGIFAGSSYLSGLIRRDPVRFLRLLNANPEAHLASLISKLDESGRNTADPKQMMVVLRAFKNEAALLIALADLGGVWPIMTVTRAITEVADSAVAASIGFLFRQAQAKGEWLGDDNAEPQSVSGFFVLAMGKHGAFELNYSSDIDLIVFYDREKARLRDGIEPQQFFVKLTQQMFRFMNERTPDGYVFRTDLRLRPDPGATQVAMSTDSALHYYESFGQNWERAAMIKARPIAGDIVAGESFLRELSPFIWRKYLDFAAISDIHAMKRQIHAHRGFGEIAVAGHNIKVGRGGIREIEFFAQTQQLIAGGRQPELRTRATLDTLDGLVERGWVAASIRDDLNTAYCYLRWLEHRIQMVADEQSQTLPKDDDALAAFARFCGYEDAAALGAALTAQLGIVRQHYGALFEDGPQLSSPTANLVFTGEDDDPDTLAALTSMGFQRPAQAIATVRSWHRGRHAAVRSSGARERLTVVQPLLIEALGDTIDPDTALLGFDRFLGRLPAGIQLFALLRANPDLMRLVAAIMGSAPRLANILSKRRRVIDAVLDPGIMGVVPGEGEIAAKVAGELAAADSFEDALDRARIVGGEQSFLIGVRLLTGMIGAGRAGGAYALLAEEVIRQLQLAVEADFAKRHGSVEGSAAAVLAMGKLGGREMTAASDLDLILIYSVPDEVSSSDGQRPLAVSQYFARLTQRIISALSAPTAKGLLYDVDMRLRPSGQKGPVATQLSSFVDYQANQAWTWEHMALTRARVISGSPQLRADIEEAIRETLCRKRDPETIRAEVVEMRERIVQEKGTDNIWDLKQVRGGLVDVEFTCQYLQLIHAFDDPGVLDQTTGVALGKLRAAGFLDEATANCLLSGLKLMSNLTQILRLCSDGPFDPAKAPDGLKQLLARVAGAPSFNVAEAQLRDSLQETHAVFQKIIGFPKIIG